MPKISAKNALLLWQKAGLLDDEKVRELSDYLLARVAVAGNCKAVLVSLETR